MSRKVLISLCFLLLLFDCCTSLALPKHCGTSRAAGGSIMGGTRAKLGQFPWLGAWCHGTTTEKCFCSVNLITSQHVVTAAHCLHQKHQRQATTYWPGTSIHFGRYDLSDDEEEEESQVRKIIDVFIHEDWKPKSEIYDADIALLRLNKPVRFTASRIRFVRTQSNLNAY